MRRVMLMAIVICVLASAIVHAAPNQQANAFQLFILETRTDLERLANEVLGTGVRMDSWTFNADLGSDVILVDLWFDNEQLADAIFGPGTRPPEWFGATATDPVLIVRNVRHDLELSAEEVFGVRSRPEDWVGAPPIYQCDRTLQNTTRLLDVFYDVSPATPRSTFNYCESVLNEIVDELLPVMYNTVEPTSQGEDVMAKVSAVRGDLERLANELLGLHTRPLDWSGSLDEQSQTFASEIRDDLVRLSDLELGNNAYPDGWKGFIPTSLIVTARNLRNNLELLADATLGEDTRPHGWQGVDPLFHCSLLEQGLVTLLQRQYPEFIIDPTWVESGDFCARVNTEANGFAEAPPERAEEEESIYVAESEYAFAYLDPAASQYMGIMPGGTEFTAWFRNFGESSMMFVTGENFNVFIDVRWTTMDIDIFNTLPHLETRRPETFCDAGWCNGPGPTPTPTGGGPLMAVLTYATPLATINADQVVDKTQVSWNHVRVIYLLDRPETGTVQVALEICPNPLSADPVDVPLGCEPVISVYDSALSGPKPVLSQFNGLNVYEFRYGYNSNVVIEGATLVSPDIWISDPTIR